MRFSQRQTITPATKIVQREEIDQDLRNSLWNVLTLLRWRFYRHSGAGHSIDGRSDTVRGSNLENLIVLLWFHFFKRSIDSIEEYWENCLKEIREFFFKAQWYEVYDFIEFVVNYGPNDGKKELIKALNSVLEQENSAYRFVNEQIVEITSVEEIETIESVLQVSEPYAGVKVHITAALAHMSSRTSPDFRNSIKESISAVESLAKQISKDESATLGDILKGLEKAKKLHPALRNAFSSLYGYTNDAQGIRHALIEEPSLTKADARFMLVCCSAFVNYTIEAVSS